MAKALYEELDKKLPSDVLPVLYNVDEDPGGLALFRLYEFQSTPTIAIVDEDTDEIYRAWSGGEIPTAEKIIEALKAVKRKE